MQIVSILVILEVDIKQPMRQMNAHRMDVSILVILEVDIKQRFGYQPVILFFCFNPCYSGS